MVGLPNERFFPLTGTKPLEVEFAAAAERRRTALGFSPRHCQKCNFWRCPAAGRMVPLVQACCAAGHSMGTRPVFELVTGVSTGALSAPFAYLGSSYDPQLRAVYTELTPDHAPQAGFYCCIVRRRDG